MGKWVDSSSDLAGLNKPRIDPLGQTKAMFGKPDKAMARNRSGKTPPESMSELQFQYDHPGHEGQHLLTRPVSGFPSTGVTRDYYEQFMGDLTSTQQAWFYMYV